MPSIILLLFYNYLLISAHTKPEWNLKRSMNYVLYRLKSLTKTKMATLKQKKPDCAKLRLTVRNFKRMSLFSVCGFLIYMLLFKVFNGKLLNSLKYKINVQNRFYFRIYFIYIPIYFIIIISCFFFLEKLHRKHYSV